MAKKKTKTRRRSRTAQRRVAQSFTLDPDVVEALEVAAAQESVSMSEFVNRTLRAVLQSEEKVFGVLNEQALRDMVEAWIRLPGVRELLEKHVGQLADDDIQKFKSGELFRDDEHQ